jgi:hypothetical protein
MQECTRARLLCSIAEERASGKYIPQERMFHGEHRLSLIEEILSVPSNPLPKTTPDLTLLLLYTFVGKTINPPILTHKIGPCPLLGLLPASYEVVYSSRDGMLLN